MDGMQIWMGVDIMNFESLSRIDRFSLGPIEEGSKRGRDGSRGGRGSS